MEEEEEEAEEAEAVVVATGSLVQMLVNAGIVGRKVILNIIVLTH